MRDEATAYHEAGHAVVAVVLGCHFTRVSINRRLDQEGAVSGFTPRGPNSYFGWRVKTAVICASGSLAECHWADNAGAPFDSRGGDNDFEHILWSLGVVPTYPVRVAQAVLRSRGAFLTGKEIRGLISAPRRPVHRDVVRFAAALAMEAGSVLPYLATGHLSQFATP